MRSEHIVLGMDLGSSSFKVAVYAGGDAPIGESSRPIEYERRAGGVVEIDVRHVEDSFAAAASEALSSAGVAPDECEALAITSQAHTYTVVDERGEATKPFVSWLDGRGAAAAAEIRDRLHDFGEHCSFGDVSPGLQISKLVHFARRKDAPVAPHERVLLLPTYLARALCGRAVVDDNLAAMTGLYSLRLGDWWPDALALCGLRSERLPDLAPVGSVVGRTTDAAARLGIPSGLELVLAGNDQTAGAYGARVRPGGALLVTIGSAHVAYAATDALVAPEPEPGLARGPYPGGGHYVFASNSGGDVVRWAAEHIGGGLSIAEFYDAARAAPHGCAGVRFELDTGRCSGSWSGDGAARSAANDARAVTEELARRAAKMVDSVRAKATFSSIRLAGGGLRSSIWLETLSQELASKIEATGASPALGAALMAQDALARAEA